MAICIKSSWTLWQVALRQRYILESNNYCTGRHPSLGNKFHQRKCQGWNCIRASIISLRSRQSGAAMLRASKTYSTPLLHNGQDITTKRARVEVPFSSGFSPTCVASCERGQCLPRRTSKSGGAVKPLHAFLVLRRIQKKITRNDNDQNRWRKNLKSPPIDGTLTRESTFIIYYCFVSIQSQKEFSRRKVSFTFSPGFAWCKHFSK